MNGRPLADPKMLWNLYYLSSVARAQGVKQQIIHVVLQNVTLPSPMAKFAPPGCVLPK